MEQNKKKYLLLFLRTGGGHLAPAKAISEYYKKYRSGEIEPVLYDGFEESTKLIKNIVVDGYRILQDKSRFIFSLIYAVHKIKLVAQIASSLVNFFVEKKIEEKILETNPDKIVIVHFFLIKAVNNTLRKHNLNIPVITVVTDPFTAHPIWFLNKNQNFVSFSDSLKDYIIKKGVEKEKIKVLPFPLSERFSGIPINGEKVQIKEQFGFKSDKIVLLLGGADGIPSGLNILKNIYKNKIDYEVAIVCGNNKELFNKVAKWKERNKVQSLKIFGFTDKIYELINISGVIITKCGASTIMEILISKKIPVVSSYLWEQEKGNVEFIVENKLGVYETKFSHLPQIIDNLFRDGEKFHNPKIKIENGTELLANYIGEFELENN